MSKNVHLFSSYHSELKSSEKGSFFELIASGQKAERRVPFLGMVENAGTGSGYRVAGGEYRVPDSGYRIAGTG